MTDRGSGRMSPSDRSPAAGLAAWVGVIGSLTRVGLPAIAGPGVETGDGGVAGLEAGGSVATATAPALASARDDWLARSAATRAGTRAGSASQAGPGSAARSARSPNPSALTRIPGLIGVRQTGSPAAGRLTIATRTAESPGWTVKRAVRPSPAMFGLAPNASATRALAGRSNATWYSEAD